MPRLLPKPDPMPDGERVALRDACRRVWRLRITRAGAERDLEAVRVRASTTHIDWHGHRSEASLVRWIEQLTDEEAEARQALDGVDVPPEFVDQYLGGAR